MLNNIFGKIQNSATHKTIKAKTKKKFCERLKVLEFVNCAV